MLLGLLLATADAFSSPQLPSLPSVRVCSAAERARGMRIRMQVERLTLTLTDCINSGIGLGLDRANRVDLLTAGKAAEKVLQMGDHVISWNGTPLFDPDGNQRKLATVVTSAETHTVVVERTLNPLVAAAAIAIQEADEAAAARKTEQASSKGKGSKWSSMEEWTTAKNYTSTGWQNKDAWKPTDSWGSG